MTRCECGKKPEHHPSLHFAETRDSVMLQAEEFMDRVYPEDIFVTPFNRKQIANAIACFVTEQKLGKAWE